MIDEPQTLVWLPTLHRLAMSETGVYCTALSSQRSWLRDNEMHGIIYIFYYYYYVSQYIIECFVIYHHSVKHEGKCNICKMFPIVGFRWISIFIIQLIYKTLIDKDSYIYRYKEELHFIYSWKRSPLSDISENTV